MGLVVKKTTKKTASEADQALNFEASLEELENLVELMEAGDITLEASLTHFERGITLTRQCQKALQQAEQKVQILMKDNSGLESFNKPESTE